VVPEFPNGILTAGDNQTAISATTNTTGSNTTMRRIGAVTSNAATGTGAASGNSGDVTTTSVFIVPGSFTLTTTAYQPKVEVSIGTTVVWTNDDLPPHCNVG
jgi:plastocyanin